MDDINKLIEISEEDDCLLYPHSGEMHDLLSYNCSPHFQISNPSPFLGINYDYKSNSNDIDKFFVAEHGAEKENSDSNKSDENKLKLDPQQMKKKKRGVNLRKSLAWDKAFFTDEGVLNPRELAILNGNATGSVGLREICEEDEGVCDNINSPVSTIINEIQEEKYLTSIKPTSTPNSRLHLQNKPSSSKKISPSIKSKGAILPSSVLKAATKEASSASLLPKPSAARKIKLPPKSTKFPAVASKQEPSTHAKKTETVKPRQPRTVSQQAKSIPTRIDSNSCLKSSVSKPSQPLRRQEAPSQTRIQSAKQCTKETDTLLRPHSISLADSSGDYKAQPSLLPKGRNIRSESAKPSGLRMPSPSLGFFGQSKGEGGGITNVAQQKPPLPKKLPIHSSKGSLISSDSNVLKQPKTEIFYQVETQKAALPLPHKCVSAKDLNTFVDTEETQNQMQEDCIGETLDLASSSQAPDYEESTQGLPVESSVENNSANVFEEESVNEEDRLCGELISFYMGLVTGNEDSAEKEMEAKEDDICETQSAEREPLTESPVKITAALKLPSNAAPFSDEWLAAYEAAGEEALTMKSGAVQNSPNNIPVAEPSPWSPVNRNQSLGPFDCTKITNIAIHSSDI